MKRILITLIIAGAALIINNEVKAQSYYTTYTTYNYSYGEWTLPNYVSTVVYNNYYDFSIVNARTYYVNGFLTYNLFLNVGNSYVEVVVDHYGHIVNRYYYASIPTQHVWLYTCSSPYFKPYHNYGYHTVYYYNNYHHHDYAHNHNHHKYYNNVNYSENLYVVKKNEQKDNHYKSNTSSYNYYPSRPESERVRSNESANKNNRNYSNTNSYDRTKSNNGNHYGQYKERTKSNNGNHYGQYKNNNPSLINRKK